jgi:hypothetical protein
VSLLVERVARGLTAGPAHGVDGVAALLGVARQALERVEEPRAVLVASGDRPFFVDALEQLAAAQRDRLLRRARPHELLERARIEPHIPVEADAVTGRHELVAAQRAAQRPRRAAQARARARVQDVGPEVCRDLAARVHPRVQREPREKLPGAAARRRLQRLAVPFHRDLPQQSNPEHATNIRL